MSLSVQFYTMLAMIAMGSFFGATLDTYQRFLKRGERKKIIVFINDILFWLVQGLIVFYVLFLVNYGELRFYLAVALLCGFAAYNALIKSTYLRLLEWMISFVQASARFIYRLFLLIIYKPIKGLIILLISIVLFIYRLLLGVVKVIGKVLLWLVKIIFYPIFLIGKGIWKLVPKRAKRYIEFIYHWLTRYYTIVKRVIRKGIGMMNKLFRK
ncbi:spore cortex biosynthesis protein YabQ [Bacillus sp. FJAT-50079]|uniref:spore cortex biosynthesis protein YabQ n=1 Tax=Bacillus sp. FJAT-50079 TaxID=2833577 RepID=UPI001BCA1543|nr:spore cortex biosynthesis protein YabQ [Bacillus sp. FJAT-50079]MBS4210812.1 spore cortex biosynthesis protein YabQ [Bacillus sp. FJAT-50079]